MPQTASPVYIFGDAYDTSDHNAEAPNRAGALGGAAVRLLSTALGM